MLTCERRKPDISKSETRGRKRKMMNAHTLAEAKIGEITYKGSMNTVEGATTITLKLAAP